MTTIKKKRPVAKKLPTGPEADRLKLTGNWKTSVGVALAKKKPKAGWPKT